jgi:hypothetical protein
MAALNPPVLVPSPSNGQPTRYGLLQAAVGPIDLPVHGRQGGTQYVTSICGEGYGYETVCLTDGLAAKTFTNPLTVVTGYPFVIYSTILCGSVGYTQAEFAAFAVARLKAVEQTVLEQIFSAGTFGQAPSLANNTPNATTVVGAGVTSVEVLSELENAVYCTSSYGGTAYIHAPIAVLNDLVSNHILTWDGRVWRTPMGSIVSAGCYSNLTPAGAAPAAGTFWMYATGQTTIWRTPDAEIFVSPIEGSLDRETNQQRLLAEREYVLTTECTTYAKSVTLW